MKRFPRISKWLSLSRYLDALVASWNMRRATCRDVIASWSRLERRSRRRASFIPEFEQLEIRWLPSAPTVTLTAPSNSNNGGFYVTVSATGTNLSSPVARLDVDLNDNGNFTDSGEQNYTTANMTQTGTGGNGVTTWSATFTVSSALSNGTFPLEARVINSLNQTGTSSTLTTVVNTSPTTWTTTNQIRSSDVEQGLLIPSNSLGLDYISPQTGNVRMAFPLDFDLSPGTSVGSLNGETAAPALVYNSDTAAPQPIIEATLASDPNGSVPTSITTQLTIDGTIQTWTILNHTYSWQTFSTTGHSAGDSYLLAQQAANAVTTTGVHTWTLYIQNSFSSGGSIDRIISGTVFVVANNSNDPFGYGWSVAGLDQLVPVTGGVWYVYGLGGSRFFSGSGPSYTSPANDFGALVKNGDGTYTYTAKDTTKFNFNTSGLLTSVVDSHNLALTYTYSSGNLSTVATPDGGLATFSYSSGLLSTIKESGNRVLTMTYTSGDLTQITEPNGDARSFSYSVHHVTIDGWAVSMYFTYSSTWNDLTNWKWNTDQYNITPEAVQGMTTSPALNSNQAVAVVTDPLSNKTTYTLDSLGRETKLQLPDGTTQNWQLNSAGLPTVYTDQLSRVTTMVYNTAGDLTQITFPDSSIENFQYDSTFHKVTQIQDTLGNLTTMTYGTQGDLTSVKNALNQITTMVWSNGLLQSVTDPLNHTTSFLYDTNRRLQVTQDALNDLTTLSYDTSGNLSTTKDALGRVTTTVFDGMNRLVKVVDANGGVTTLGYNALGEQTSIVDPDGNSHSTNYNSKGLVSQAYQQRGSDILAYDADGRLSTRTDANSKVTTLTYDSVDRLKTRTSPVGGVETFTYDNDGELITSTDANNNTTTYGYNIRGWQTTITDALNHTATLAYDTEGNLTSEVDRNGNRATMVYDALNRLIQTTNALSGISTIVYDAAGNVSATVDELGRRTTFTYDALNRLIQRTDALLDLSTLVYDAVSNVIARVDPLGNRTTMSYDNLNRLTTTRDPLNNVATLAYDAASNLIAETNARGNITSMTYDTYNQLSTTKNALGGVETLTYDAVGNLQTQVDELGKTSTLVYDGLNRQIATTDPLGHTSTVVFDNVGNVIRTIDALGNAVTMTYDGDNRLVTTQDPGGGIQTLVYDNVGNVVNTIDPLGNKSTFVFDALNRQTKSIDPRGGTTTTVYDAVGNVVNVIDPVGNKSTFVFDALNREIQEIDPLGNSLTMAYDAASRLVSRTDRDGRRINFSYDADNRLTGETWISGGSTVNLLTFTYDPNGNLLTGADYHGAYTLTYDALDRLATQKDMWGLALTMAYDPVSNRTSLQDSLGGTLTSVYDAAHRLTTREFGGSGQTPLRLDLTYTNTDRIATETRYTDLAGTNKIGSTTMTYDAVGRLTNLQHFNGSMTILANYTYTYDVASRLTTEVLNGTTTTYQYDTANQLTSDTANNYLYDLNGNRTSGGAQIGGNNEITTDGTWTYTFDQEGNLIKKSKGTNAETWTFGYDNLNHLIWAKDSATDGGAATSLATYLYDVFGDRVEKDLWSSGTTTILRFAYDLGASSPSAGAGLGSAGNLWADLNGSGGLLMRYIFGDSVDQLFARIYSTGTATWFLTDRLGSVRDITDNTGAVIDHLNYDGFGNVTSETEPWNGSRFQWTGREFDSETGLQYNRARYYDPKLGRWTSQDPAGFRAGDPNLYRYVINDTPNVTDPSGLYGPGAVGPVITDPAVYAAAMQQARQQQAAPVKPSGAPRHDVQGVGYTNRGKAYPNYGPLGLATPPPGKRGQPVYGPGDVKVYYPKQAYNMRTNKVAIISNDTCYNDRYGWVTAKQQHPNVGNYRDLMNILDQYEDGSIDVLIFSGHMGPAGQPCSARTKNKNVNLGGTGMPPGVYDMIRRKLSNKGDVIIASCMAGAYRPAVQQTADAFQVPVTACTLTTNGKGPGPTAGGGSGDGPWVTAYPDPFNQLPQLPN